jgi:hypothetical protein
VVGGNWRELVSITLCPESQLRLCSTPVCRLLLDRTTKAMLSEEEKIRLIHECRTALFNRIRAGGFLTSAAPFVREIPMAQITG